MWSRLLLGCALATAARAQPNSAQFELANLREDVRGLLQRVGELVLRVEQLERENADLRRRESSSDRRAFATLAQLNEAVGELERTWKGNVAASKTETLQIVATQMEKLARQTNTALDALAKTPSSVTPARAPGSTIFSEDYSKEGASYVVQKGDTLAVIAKKTGAKQQDLINANKISDPSLIKIGQTLFIPGAK